MEKINLGKILADPGKGGVIYRLQKAIMDAVEWEKKTAGIKPTLLSVN